MLTRRHFAALIGALLVPFRKAKASNVAMGETGSFTIPQTGLVKAFDFRYVVSAYRDPEPGSGDVVYDYIQMTPSDDGKWHTVNIPLAGSSLTIHTHGNDGEDYVRTTQAFDPVTKQPIGERVVTRTPLKNMRL